MARVKKTAIYLWRDKMTVFNWETEIVVEYWEKVVFTTVEAFDFVMIHSPNSFEEDTSAWWVWQDWDSAYQVAVNNGFVWSEQDRLASLQWPKWDKWEPWTSGWSVPARRFGYASANWANLRFYNSAWLLIWGGSLWASDLIKYNKFDWNVYFRNDNYNVLRKVWIDLTPVDIFDINTVSANAIFNIEFSKDYIILCTDVAVIFLDYAWNVICNVALQTRSVWVDHIKNNFYCTPNFSTDIYKIDVQNNSSSLLIGSVMPWSWQSNSTIVHENCLYISMWSSIVLVNLANNTAISPVDNSIWTVYWLFVWFLNRIYMVWSNWICYCNWWSIAKQNFSNTSLTTEYSMYYYDEKNFIVYANNQWSVLAWNTIDLSIIFWWWNTNWGQTLC